MTADEKEDMEWNIIHNHDLTNEEWLKYGEYVREMSQDERTTFYRTLAGRILAQVLSMKRFRS